MAEFIEVRQGVFYTKAVLGAFTDETIIFANGETLLLSDTVLSFRVYVARERQAAVDAASRLRG